MQKKSSCFIVSLLIICGIDIVLSAIYLYSGDGPSDGMTTIFIIIPLLVIANLVLALLAYLFKYRFLLYPFLLNCIFLPVIYVQIAKAHTQYWMEHLYKTYYFIHNNQRFEIELETKTGYYSFMEVYETGSRSGYTGNYKTQGDSIILTDSSGRKIIKNNLLIGYPTKADTFRLKIKPIR